MGSEYQNAEDERVFKEILSRDPESKKCFECGYPSAPWCDINHGVFMCLDCSGVHRGLGVHLSFVRSSTMDGWSNWRPEKLKQMQLGGNGRARKFFEAKGVPASPIRTRYSHVGALMYKDKLEAEVAGRPFNEAAWQPPDWANPAKQQQQQQQARAAGGAAAGGAGRFQGQGSQRPAKAGGGGGGGDDWMAALSSGLTAVAETTTKAATAAATVTVSTTQQLATQVQQQSRNVDTEDLSKKAAETAAKTTAAVSSAWSSAWSWTASAVSQLGDAASGPAGGASGDDDGLSGLTRNLAGRDDDPQSDPRFRGVAHQAEPGSPGSPGGLAGLTRDLPRGSKYEGVGGSPVAAAPAAPMPAKRPTSGMGSRQTSSASPGSPAARGSPAPAGGAAVRKAPSAQSSPAPASPTSAAGTTGGGSTGGKSSEKKSAVPDEWGWDD